MSDYKEPNRGEGMREIKFRAWHHDERKMWVNIGTDGLGGIILDTRNMRLQPLKGNAILMQYTGLKDNNSKEIYEGDLVRLRNHSTYPYEVYWDGRDSSFRMRFNREMQFDKTSLLLFAQHGEVIGNIYENPELLAVNP